MCQRNEVDGDVRVRSHGGAYLGLDVDSEGRVAGLQTGLLWRQRAREMNESLCSGSHAGRRLTYPREA